MADIDSLFQLPLAEFTAARNALAASLKKEGRGDEAAQIKALSKPSVPAWAVNQLYWRHRKLFDRLMASGADLRRAQASQLAGGSAELRKPMQARREALAELSRHAAAILEEAGHQSSPDMMRRITTTLEALASYGDSPDVPQPGRLVSDVDPPGFESFAALVPRTGGRSASTQGPSTVIPFRKATRTAAPRNAREAREAEEAARQAARAALQAAERALREVRALAARREAALKAAAARVKSAESAKAAAEERLERATADLQAARQEARRVAAEAEDAAQAVTDAERAVERAKQEVKG